MRLACPAIFLFLSVMLSEAKHLWMALIALVQRNKSEILRFVQNDKRLPLSSAAAEDSAKQAASDLPTEGAARGAHRALGH